MAKWQFCALVALMLVAAASSAQVIEFPDGSFYTLQAEDSSRAPWTLPGAFSYVADQISRAFSMLLDFFEGLGRLELNLVNRVVDFFSFRPTFSKGSPGATEPLGDIPEPPTMHYRAGRSRAFPVPQVRAIVNEAIDEYFTRAKDMPEASTLDGLETRLQLLKDITHLHLRAQLMCLRCARMCAFSLAEKDLVVYMAFDMLNVNPLNVVATSASISMDDLETIGMVKRVGDHLAIRLLSSGSTADDKMPNWHALSNHVKAVNEALDARCGDVQDSPVCKLREEHGDIFKAALFSGFRPWWVYQQMRYQQQQQQQQPSFVTYRRAMLFRTRNPPARVEVHIFWSSGDFLKPALMQLLDEAVSSSSSNSIEKSSVENQAAEAQSKFIHKHGASSNNVQVASM